MTSNDPKRTLGHPVMNTKDQFLTEFARVDHEIRRRKDPSYGANVMLYAGLTSAQDRRLFEEALEAWLESQDPATRQKAVKICLGFFVFRDAIGK